MNINCIDKYICNVYGSSINCHQWKSKDNNKKIKLCGFNILLGNKKYILTSRNVLIECEQIMCKFSYKETNIRQNVKIAFQCIEHDIILLSSDDNKISDNEQKFGILFYDIFKNEPKNILNKEYYKLFFLRNNFFKKIGHAELNFDQIYIKNDTYLPSNILLSFTQKKIIKNIIGSLVLDNNNEIVGIISDIKLKNVYVLPFLTIFNILLKFSNNVYNGDLLLPFSYNIVDNKIIINKIYTKNIDMLKGDILVNLNSYKFNIINNIIYVYSQYYQEYIDIELFFRLYGNDKFIFEIIRDDINISIKLKKQTMTTKNLNLTDCPYKNFINPIPYTIINGLVIVKLTHELIDYYYARNYNLVNDYLENFISSENEKLIAYYIVVDIINDDIYNKYNLQNINQYNPIVTKINGKKFKKISNIKNNFNSIELKYSEQNLLIDFDS